MQSGRGMKGVGKSYGPRTEELSVASRRPISREPKPSRSRAKAFFDDSEGNFTLFRFPLGESSERHGSVYIIRYRLIPTH